MPELIHRQGLGRLLEEWRVTHEDTTHTFSNLNGDADVLYLLSGFLESHCTVARFVNLKPNNITTNMANAGHVGGSAGHATWNQVWTGMRILDVAAKPSIAVFEVLFYAKTGTSRLLQSDYSIWTYPANDYNSNVHEVSDWSETSTAITSLVLAITGDHFGSGVVRLYAL